MEEFKDGPQDSTEKAEPAKEATMDGVGDWKLPEINLAGKMYRINPNLYVTDVHKVSGKLHGQSYSHGQKGYKAVLRADVGAHRIVFEIPYKTRTEAQIVADNYLANALAQYNHALKLDEVKEPNEQSTENNLHKLAE